MTTQLAFTRTQYLNGECTFDQYYAQYLNDSVVSIVRRHFPIQKLKDAYEVGEDLNDIPLAEWGYLCIHLRSLSLGIGEKMRGQGDYPTLSGWVCLLKVAAKQIILTN